MDVAELSADATPAQVNDKVFEGIGSLQAYVDKARAENATALTIMMTEFDQIEARIKELAAAYVSSLVQRQDLDYLKEMDEAEAEAIERQNAGGEGWA